MTGITSACFLIACVSNGVAYLVGYTHATKAQQVRALRPPARRRRGAVVAGALAPTVTGKTHALTVNATMRSNAAERLYNS